MIAMATETTAATTTTSLRPLQPTDYKILLYGRFVRATAGPQQSLALPADTTDDGLPSGCYVVERLVTKRSVKVRTLRCDYQHL